MCEDGSQFVADGHSVDFHVGYASIDRFSHIVPVTVVEFEGHMLGIGLLHPCQVESEVRTRIHGKTYVTGSAVPSYI